MSWRNNRVVLPAPTAPTPAAPTPGSPLLRLAAPARPVLACSQPALADPLCCAQAPDPLFARYLSAIRGHLRSHLLPSLLTDKGMSWRGPAQQPPSNRGDWWDVTRSGGATATGRNAARATVMVQMPGGLSFPTMPTRPLRVCTLHAALRRAAHTNWILCLGYQPHSNLLATTCLNCSRPIRCSSLQQVVRFFVHCPLLLASTRASTLSRHLSAVISPPLVAHLPEHAQHQHQQHQHHQHHHQHQHQHST